MPRDVHVRVLGGRRFGRGARRFSRWPRVADKVFHANANRFFVV
jgi:hypothetical protein